MLSGWTRRGAAGVIGTNRRDANDTADALLADAAELPRAPTGDPDALLELLARRGVRAVSWSGWQAIE